jgi:hypothetical protein
MHTAKANGKQAPTQIDILENVEVENLNNRRAQKPSNTVLRKVIFLRKIRNMFDYFATKKCIKPYICKFIKYPIEVLIDKILKQLIVVFLFLRSVTIDFEHQSTFTFASQFRSIFILTQNLRIIPSIHFIVTNNHERTKRLRKHRQEH